MSYDNGGWCSSKYKEKPEGLVYEEKTTLNIERTCKTCGLGVSIKNVTGGLYIIKHGGVVKIVADGVVIKEHHHGCNPVVKNTVETITMPAAKEVWIWVGRGMTKGLLGVASLSDVNIFQLYAGSVQTTAPVVDFVNYSSSIWWRTSSRAEVLLASYNNSKRIMATAWYNASSAICFNSNHSTLTAIIAGVTLPQAQQSRNLSWSCFMVSEEEWELLDVSGSVYLRYEGNETFAMSIKGGQKVDGIPVDNGADGTVPPSLNATYTDACWSAFLGWAYQRHQCSKVSYVFKCIVETIAIIAIVIASLYVARVCYKVYQCFSEKSKTKEAMKRGLIKAEVDGLPLDAQLLK